MEDQWCNLPKDILELISKKIISIEDYLRLRAVCIPWRSALPPNPRHFPPQSPWLMLPYDPHYDNEHINEGSIRNFYDISSSKIRKISLPETRGKRYCGSSKGWLMLQNGPKFSLLNPITKVQINLPSLKSSPKVLGVEDPQSLDDIRSRLDIWSRRSNFEDSMGSSVQRAILTSNPSLDPNCIVMVIFRNNWRLAFCRIGDESWTICEAPNYKGELYDYSSSDVTFHNESFYYIYRGEVKIYNRDCSKREVWEFLLRQPIAFVRYHLLEGNFNELILIATRTSIGYHERDVYVFKLGIEAGQPYWTEIEGIGEKPCFICDYIEQCFTLEGLRGDIAYYAHFKIIEKVAQSRIACRSKEKFGYEIKMIELPNDEQIPNNFDRKEYVSKIRANFGPYPLTYSRAIWCTPTF